MRSAESRSSPKRLLWRRIEELELPLRPLNVLHGAGITTLADLVNRSEAELLALKNFGRKDIILLREKLAALGLRLGMVSGRGRRRIRSPGSVRREVSSR